jgi:hypothetical protein
MYAYSFSSRLATLTWPVAMPWTTLTDFLPFCQQTILVSYLFSDSEFNLALALHLSGSDACDPALPHSASGPVVFKTLGGI